MRHCNKSLAQDVLCCYFSTHLRTGTFNADTGAAPCSACPAGTYQDGSTPTVCLLCGANQVQPAPGQSSCEDCPTGTASADGITCSFPACDPGGSNSRARFGMVARTTAGPTHLR